MLPTPAASVHRSPISTSAGKSVWERRHGPCSRPMSVSSAEIPEVRDVRKYFFVAAISLVVSGTALAQVPPEIAAGIRKIGPIVDTVNTAKLYAPYFEDQKE